MFFKKRSKYSAALNFADPILLDIRKNINLLESELNKNNIPNSVLHDLIKNIKSFSVNIESSNKTNKVELTAALAKMHDNSVQCSIYCADKDFNTALIHFRNIQMHLEEISSLL